MIPPVGICSAGVALTLALLCVLQFLAAGPCLANPASGLFELLNPAIGRDLGLGGDPFLSSAADQTSWWRDSMQADRTTLHYGLDYYEPISPRLTRGRGWLRHVGNEFRGASSLPLGTGRLFGQLGVSNQDQELMVDDLGNMYSIAGKGSQVDALIRLQDLPEGLVCQVTVPVSASSEHMRSMPLGFGLRYGVPGGFIQVSRVRRHYNHAVNLQVENEVIDSALNMSRLIWTVDSRINLGPASWFAYTFASNEFGEIDQLTDAYRYEIIPVGTATTYAVELAAGRQDRYAFLLRGRWNDYDLGGSAYWGGQRFGKISYLSGDHRAGVLAFEAYSGESNRWLVDVTLTELRGRAWGKIESWPFTDSIGDLIGGKMTFKGGFRAHWMRLHAGLDRPVGGGRLKVGLIWYNIFPEAEARTWRSGLGFPLESPDYYTLDTDHLQIGALSLGGIIPWGAFRLDLAVYQVVFGNIHNTYHRPEDEDEDPPAGPEANPAGWFGGTYARVGLRYLF